jgi:hypothetical protein
MSHPSRLVRFLEIALPRNRRELWLMLNAWIAGFIWAAILILLPVVET